MSRREQSGWTYLRMRNNLRVVLQPQVEALQITALLFRSDELQSRRDQAQTPPPRGPRRILRGAGVPLGAGLSLEVAGSMRAPYPGLSGNLTVMQSQLKELGTAALKPGLGFQEEGVRPVPPLPVLHPQKHWPQESD